MNNNRNAYILECLQSLYTAGDIFNGNVLFFNANQQPAVILYKELDNISEYRSCKVRCSCLQEMFFKCLNTKFNIKMIKTLITTLEQ